MTQELRYTASILLLLLCSFPALFAQGTRADYERAAGIRQQTQNKVFKSRVQPNWFDNNNRFWYRNDLVNGGREFIVVDAIKGRREPAFDHERMADALTKVLNKQVQANRLPVEWLDFRKEGLFVLAESRTWAYDARSHTLSERKDIILNTPALTALRAVRPSRRTGEETSVTFINKTSQSITLFWIDTEGRRQKYETIKPGEQYHRHTYGGHVWLVTDESEKPLAVFEAGDIPGTVVVDGTQPVPREREIPERRGETSLSPDGAWQVFVKEHNLYLRRRATDEEFALAADGTHEDGYSARVYWSPDSKKLIAPRMQAGQERKVYLIESSPQDQLQPKLHTLDYLKPGDRLPIMRLQLFEAETGKRIPIDEGLYPNPWQVSDIRWEPDSQRFTFIYNQRGHQVLRLIAVDAQTGEAKAVIDERSKTFIDYAGKYFIHYLDKTDEVIWMSERDGWNHLYLYDTQSGRVKNQITRGEWVVRSVELVDEERRQIRFRAGGVYPGQDPYYVHVCRVNFDGSGFTILTEGDGTRLVQFSPDNRFLIDTYSRVDMPPVTELRRVSDGKLICLLETADASALFEAGWRAPERFVAKGRDGKTDIYGVIIRPTNFDPAKKYPVIENIYAGPQGAFVPKAWSSYYGMQELAELGFIVVQIDGMGTSHRSKAFHDVCWKNLGDAGLPDRILWIQAAAKAEPAMDLSRVGIYGGSAGGQNALRAVLAHGDFYKVAVADCGCHDNRMDKVWWNELWMGYPVGPEYEESSNVTHAHKLQGKLLLVVGEMDTNVDPASTMQVVSALIKANKDFDLLVMPGTGHGAAETPYGRRRRQDFFVRHLLGVEPRSR